MDVWKQMRTELDALEAEDLLRRPAEVDSPCRPVVRVGGREVVCLCSNDYLSLAADPAIRAAAIQAVGQWGVGAGASRLVSGTQSPHALLERRLAQFKRAEAAIVTSTGWMANHVAIHALAGAGDLVLSDKLNHASILDAALACGARVRTYPHRDTARLRKLLDAHRAAAKRCLIVTDSLFSMDGDLAPLGELAELKKRYDAVLMIDEAHATGVLGKSGRGAAELLGVEGDVDVVVGTLSKALGSLGGFVAGPAVLVETIRNRGRAFIYTTAPPAALCAAALAALEIVEREPQRRGRLLELAAALREQLAAAGLAPTPDPREPATPIVPIVVGEPARAVQLSRGLLEEGFLVPAIRPPTVPRGTSRLRVSLSAGHTPEQLARFVEMLRRRMPGP